MTKRTGSKIKRERRGRPKSMKVHPTRVLGVKLEPELWDKLDALAERERRTLAQLGYFAVRQYVEEKAAAASAA